MALSGGAGAADSSSRPSWCPAVAAEAAAGPSRLFRKIAEKAARREVITLVAIGSSSTEGSDLADKALAYPNHLETRLNALLGQGVVRVVNKGLGGEAIPDTVARFQRDVVALKPDLVIWQLGANDIVRRADLGVTARGLQQGMEQLEALGAPVVLMDTQTAPSVTLSPTLEPVQAMLRKAADRYGALFWSRYALMSGILAAKAAQGSDLIKADNLHMTVPMHICTGKVLAEVIAAQVPAVPAGVISASR